MNWVKDTPWWVLGICLALASIEPITHFGLQRIDSEPAAHSGLHTPDSAIYLACMRMFENDFFSPYATCNAPNGPHDPAFLPTPFHWLYAILGEIGRGLGIGEFMFLGLANGFFGFVYLVVVYRFLRTAIPDFANLAFVLWALGGGLGGVFFVVSWLTGAHTAQGFEAVSFRFAMYELIEGPGLFPLLHIPRLYYTTSLALGFGFLSAFITGMRIACRQHLFFSCLLLFGSAVINVRFGAFAWSAAVMYLLCSGLTLRRCTVLSALTLVPLAAATSVFAAMQWSRPIFTETALAIVRESIWPTGFLAAGAFYLPPFCVALWLHLPGLPRLARTVATGAAGYLAIVVPLVLAHKLYYGNFWTTGDQAALARVSDFALFGAVAGLAIGWKRRGGDDTTDGSGAWFVLWAVVFLAAGVSALGQGWGVRLAPQRFLAMLGVPLSVCAAMALAHFAGRFPRGVRWYTGLIVACGILSIAVGSLIFQAPVGRTPQTELYAARHPELLARENAELLQQLAPGIVLTSPEIADAVAMVPGMRVLGGIGSTDLSDASSLELDTLFRRYCGDPASREALLEQWCVDYVLVPHNATCDLTSEELGLELVATSGSGRLYRVLD